MQILKLVAITLLSALALGCIFGVIIGKHQLKKMRGESRALLSKKERIVYTACMLLGIGAMAFGIFYTSPTSAENLYEGENMGVQEEFSDKMPDVMGASPDYAVDEDADVSVDLAEGEAAEDGTEALEEDTETEDTAAAQTQASPPRVVSRSRNGGVAVMR